jgi:glycosyl transferase family 25
MSEQDPATVDRAAGQCPVLVINLDRSPGRLAFQRLQADRLGLDFERVAAVDGALLPQSEYELHAYRWHRPLSRSEVGCLLSHAACWRRVVELGQNVVVLEDDLVLAQETAAFLREAKALTGAAVVNLETRGRPRFISQAPVETLGEQRLHTLHAAVAGSAAYLVTPLAAARLLEKLPRKAALADAFLWGRRGIRYLQADPALGMPLDFLEDSGRAVEEAVSTIRRPHLKLAEKLALALRHPLMRARRANNQLQVGLTKLAMKGTALMSTVAPTPSIFATYDALKGAGHG